jgi:putative tricarboxylic transport membrane protein
LVAAGLALIAAVAGHDIVRGLIAALIGVLLTVPGQDDMTGQLRLTFHNPDLVGGLPEVPIMLGLFAIGSVLLLMEQKEERIAPLVRRPGVIRVVLRRLKKMWGVVTWASVVGVVIGIIPGLGANTAAVAAYSEAKRVSKNREEFGKGAWEGVAAPEAANNSIIGGVLVPLLGLGIPGSPAAAIMYGALTVHGIIAGPRLFSQRADVAYTFMVGLAFTAIAMLIVGLASIRYISLVVRAPVRFVIPTVLGLTLLGTFAFRNNMFDVVVLVFAGALGFILDKIGISWVPLTLGLVLGLLLEFLSGQQGVVQSLSTGFRDL